MGFNSAFKGLKNNSYAKYKHLDLIIDFVKITAQSTALQICKFIAWGIQLTWRPTPVLLSHMAPSLWHKVSKGGTGDGKSKPEISKHDLQVHAEASVCSRLRLKCDGTRAETRFRLSAKRTSPLKSAGGVSSVSYWQASCAQQPGVFVLLAQACVLQSCDAYWLPTPLSCFPFTSPPVRYRVPSHFNWTLLQSYILREFSLNINRQISFLIICNKMRDKCVKNSILGKQTIKNEILKTYHSPAQQWQYWQTSRSE